jgi:hypothetical protein
MVLFDQATYDKLLSEAPKYKLITPSVLSDRMRVQYFTTFFSKVYVFSVFLVTSNPGFFVYDYFRIC